MEVKSLNFAARTKTVKKIECIVKGEKLDAVIESLRINGVPGVTVTEVRGFGTQREVSPEPVLKPKVKLEIYCDDAQSEALVKNITEVGRAGQMGDGKIAIIDVENLIRIRTGQENTKALY